MEKNQRFTIMPFPQYFDGNDQIQVHILFLPRNQNPLLQAIVNNAILSNAPAFADADLVFKAVAIPGLDSFPNDDPLHGSVGAIAKKPLHKRTIFTTLADGNHFKIDNIGTNEVLEDKVTTNTDNHARAIGATIKKYLPVSYRNAFNFIAPKLRGNAVVDDSYHCAVRDAKPQPISALADTVSWGKVFAYVLRNPLLAERAGFIHKTSVLINASDFAEGGYLYIDLADDSDYKTQQVQDPTFVKRYAARIPQLKQGEARQLFAANLFPVLHKTNPAINPEAPGNYDEVFKEAAEYDDGFGKLVHCFQAVSQHLLQEESDGFHPTHDSGIRLGWDDEQILQWYVRQMSKDASAGGERLDAPIGVMGYHIDVKDSINGLWSPLNKVATKNGVDALGGLVQGNSESFQGELPFQVYPTTLDADKSKPYWLPMYFANWNGHSMVLPDEQAIAIYQHDQGVLADQKTHVDGSPKNQLLKVYDAKDINVSLQYGHTYFFRIRYTDITNGGPKLERNDVRMNDALHDVADCLFKRYVAPTTVRILDLPTDGGLFKLPSLRVKRPLLSYPAVAYTGKYANAAQKIKEEIKAVIAATPAGKKAGLENIGLSDPDVASVEITVEVQALKMDYQLSASGKESFAVLYKTTRSFGKAQNENDYDDVLDIPIVFKDASVLDFDLDKDSIGDLGNTRTEIDGMHELLLPTARQIRLTIRAVCKEQPQYYGLEDNKDLSRNSRYGRTSYLTLYEPSANEKDLYSVKTIQGIYLQPDELPQAKPVNKSYALMHELPVQMPDVVQRLSQQLKINNNGLTLVGKTGERIQFGCSARIRHTLSPDNAALTLGSKAELYHHWLCCLSITIKRDWSWDALEDLGFLIVRKKWFKQAPAEATTELVGEMELKKSISFNALQDPQRDFTKLVFIDAVEPKKLTTETNPDFPDELVVEYTVKAKFKANHGGSKDPDLSFLPLQLPVTVNPVQIPKITSAGIALSPYLRNEKYSSTEPRRRFLWVEFAEPVKDPNDLYFARVLAYAPDQLISNNLNPDKETKLSDPPLNLDPEFIRVIVPGSSNDGAGMGAMQPMQPSTQSNRHFLLPLPSGLNESSPELFGFFTYEFRMGHAEHIWSTAQGRFGRPLKATGIQHPAPTLTCAVNRDEEKLYVTSPYATAVFGGRNVTASLPRTQLWCLLYAQVKQADNNDHDPARKEKDYRNILLEDRYMHWSNKENPSDGTTSQDSTLYGSAVWTNQEVEALLAAHGLPADLSLSVLCVEMFGHITSERDYYREQHRKAYNDFVGIKELHEHQKPLSNELGNYRILRTSPLIEVPFVCCTV